MAISIPIISEFSDKGVRGAEAAFQDMRKRIGEAEGAMGKMKAGFGVATDYMKANAGTLAAVAGAAIGGFAFKAISDFKDLALEVDKFRDATGLTLDDASRWTEVAGDIDVDANVIKDAINKMNRAAADGSKAFGDLGIDLKKFKDGEYDPQDTFLQVIDQLQKIEDPAQRAKIATQLLGRGWTEMANLIEKGSATLSKSLSEVSDAKIIDEEEVKKAENYRDAMDKLNGVFEDFVLQVGDKLIPIFSNFVDLAGTALGALDDIGRAIGNVKQMTPEQLIDEIGFEKTVEVLQLTNDEINDLIKRIDPKLVPAIYGMRDAWVEGYRSMIDARRVSQDLERDLGNLEDAIAELKGEVDERQAWRNLQDDIQKAGELALQAFMEKTPEALRASEGALDDARIAAADYIAKLNDIPDDEKTEIILNLDKANIDEIEKIIKEVTRKRTVEVLMRVRREELGSGDREHGTPPPSSNVIETPFGNFVPTPGGGFEFANLGGGRSAQSMNVNVNVAGSVVSERDLVESVRKGLVDAQRSGYGLVYTNS